MHTPEGQKPRKGTLGALGSKEFNLRRRRLEVLGGETNSEIRTCLPGESEESATDPMKGKDLGERVNARGDRAFAYFRSIGKTGQSMLDALVEGVEEVHMPISRGKAIELMIRHGCEIYTLHDLLIINDPEEKK